MATNLIGAARRQTDVPAANWYPKGSGFFSDAIVGWNVLSQDVCGRGEKIYIGISKEIYNNSEEIEMEKRMSQRNVASGQSSTNPKSHRGSRKWDFGSLCGVVDAVDFFCS